jgi:cobalt-zinc-cadmium efflux system outer membrane protein
LMNRPATAPLGLAVTAPADAVDVDTDMLIAASWKERPEILGAQAGVERSVYERDLMKKKSFPDYRLGVEYRNFSTQAEPDMVNAVMFSIGFDLPIWQTKYRAAVREAQRMIDSSQAALEAAEKQASFDVQDAVFKLQEARREVELDKNALIPQAEARFNASEAGYRTGKVDFLDLLESERFLLYARLTAAKAEGKLGGTVARLERAVGTELKAGDTKQ